MHARPPCRPGRPPQCSDDHHHPQPLHCAQLRAAGLPDDAGGACGLGDRGGPLDQGRSRARRRGRRGDHRRLAIGRRGVACRRLRRPRRGLRGRGLPGVAHGAQPRPTVGGFPPRVHLECLHGRLRPHHRAVRVERRLGRAAAGRGGGRAHLLRAGRRRQPFAVGRRRRGVGGPGGRGLRRGHHPLRRGLGAGADHRRAVRGPGHGPRDRAAGGGAARVAPAGGVPSTRGGLRADGRGSPHRVRRGDGHRSAAGGRHHRRPDRHDGGLARHGAARRATQPHADARHRAHPRCRHTARRRRRGCQRERSRV